MFRVEYKQSDLPKRLQRLARKMPDVIDKAVKSVAQDAKKDFDATTETWTKRPKFVVVKDTRGWKVVVRTYGKLFKWVDLGTRGHYIRARRRKRMYYIGGGEAGTYVPKTQPNIIGSTYAFHEGTLTRVFAREVYHPGTDPRNFSKTISKTWAREGNPRVRAAIEEAINREAPGI